MTPKTKTICCAGQDGAASSRKHLRLVTKKSRHQPILDGARRWDMADDNNRYFWAAVGNRLRILRIALGQSETEIAAAIGIGVGTYRKMEQGKRGWKFDCLIDFLVERDISIEWMLRGDAVAMRRNVGGRVAILPVSTPKWRKHRNEIDADAIKDAFLSLPRPKKMAVFAFMAELRKGGDHPKTPA